MSPSIKIIEEGDANSEHEPLLLSSTPNEMDKPHDDIEELMWTKDYVALYSQYAALGLIFGMSGVGMNFCVYVYQGSSNLCANSDSIIYIMWSFKIFIAILTDMVRPWGMRRKPYMLIGWIGALSFLFLLATSASTLTATSWIGINILMQSFILVADVPIDGYLVELGRLESPEKRGQIMTTATMIRSTFSIFAALFQLIFVNGLSTNDPHCVVDWEHCWHFGITIQQYYAVMLCMIFILVLPVINLKELDCSRIPILSPGHFLSQIWDTMQSLSSFYLILFVTGIHITAHLRNPTVLFIQYYIIKLTSAQSSVDSILSGSASLLGLWIFKTFWIHKNWRKTSYFSCIVTSILGLAWILVFYDIGGLRNAWFTIFIDLDESFAKGLARVLASLAIIELAKPGQEATTFELLLSMLNASGPISAAISTQLLLPLRAIGCTKGPCATDEVDLTSVSTYESSDGPRRFTSYTLIIVVINIIGTFTFARFLPKNAQECREWNTIGDSSKYRGIRGYISMALAIVVIAYGIAGSILLLDEDTACMKAVGGSGVTFRFHNQQFRPKPTPIYPEMPLRRSTPDPLLFKPTEELLSNL
eukprot:gene2108-4119_t